MVKIEILCIGKLKEKYLNQACDEYIKRLTPFCKLKITQIQEYRCDSLNQSQIKKIIEEEGNRILKKLNKTSFKIALCIEGLVMSSEELAQKSQKLLMGGTSNITLIIGGSHGLSQKVKQASNFKLSMSPLTFPHQLARVILLEQIYRAFTIQSKKTYHK